MKAATDHSRKAISDSPTTLLVAQASRLKSSWLEIRAGENLVGPGTDEVLDRDDLVVPEAVTEPNEA